MATSPSARPPRKRFIWAFAQDSSKKQGIPLSGGYGENRDPFFGHDGVFL